MKAKLIWTYMLLGATFIPAQQPNQLSEVSQLETSGIVKPSKELDAQLRDVINMDDPPQGIVIPFRRKNNHSKLELSQQGRNDILKTALKHPFGGMLGGSGGTIDFVVSMSEPKAFVGAQKVMAKYMMKPIDLNSLTAGSRLPILRVTVNPKTPVWGVTGGNHVLNVVLTNEDQSVAIQPVLLRPFGINLSAPLVVPAGPDMVAVTSQSQEYQGLNVVFTMADLEKVRAVSSDRSFYLTIIGSGNAKKIYKVDTAYFEQLGD